MKKKIVILCVSLMLAGAAVNAAEIRPSEPAASIDKHKEYDKDHPSHETEGDFFLGYQWLGYEDSENAGEFKNLESSIYGGLDLQTYPLPHRFHVHTEFIGRDNLYGDLGYAYEDLVLFRDVFVNVYHNLDHYNYQYANYPAENITYNDKNAGDKYHISSLDNFLTLRLKTPDFPFHTYIKHRHIEKEGTVQQRSLVGYYTDKIKMSQTRSVDMQSDELTLGTNSHLGPVEVDYSTGYTKFDSGPNNVLYDAYSAGAGRAADTYPHDVIPDIESYTNTLKVHSSYTGRVVASASLGNLYRENQYSSAESNIWRGAMDLKWMPYTSLSLFLKYRHRTHNLDNPGSVTLTGIVNNAVNTYTVRRSVSTKKDTVSLSGRYRPSNKITLLSLYEFEHVARENTNEWSALPQSADSNRIRLSAQGSPRNDLQLKISYQYKNFNTPANNLEPDDSNHLSFSSTYVPTERITALIDYNLAITKRDDVQYLNNSPNVLVNGGARESRNDSLLCNLSFQVSPKLSLGPGLAYFRNGIKQGLAYGKWVGGVGDLPFLDPGVHYTDDAFFYSLSLNYEPRKDIALMADISRTETEGEFLPGIAEATAPESIASYSPIKISETIFSVDVRKTVFKDWEAGLRLYANFYDDKIDNSQDGTLYSSIISITRRF